MIQWIFSILLFLMIGMASASAQSAASSGNYNKTRGSESGLPGNFAFDSVPAASSALREFAVKVEGSNAFSHETVACFILIQDSRSVLGRIDLVPQDAKQEKLRLLLHGQEKESVRLKPGRYTLRATFWRPGELLSNEYPHSPVFNVDRGQAATLEITREDYSNIKAWLKQREADGKIKAEKKIKEERNARRVNHEGSDPRSKQ